MSVSLKAPYPALQTTTLLPNPQLADVSGRKLEIDIFRATDGMMRTSVKSNTRRLLTYNFILDPPKALELEAFIKSYIGSKIQMRNHKDEIWVGHIANNPVEFTDAAKNRVTVSIQFEGERIV